LRVEREEKTKCPFVSFLCPFYMRQKGYVVPGMSVGEYGGVQWGYKRALKELGSPGWI
jgi:hypothetical protein